MDAPWTATESHLKWFSVLRDLLNSKMTSHWIHGNFWRFLLRKWQGVPQWQRAAEEFECILEDREETFAAPDMPQDLTFFSAVPALSQENGGVEVGKSRWHFALKSCRLLSYSEIFHIRLRASIMSSRCHRSYANCSTALRLKKLSSQLTVIRWQPSLQHKTFSPVGWTFNWWQGNQVDSSKISMRLSRRTSPSCRWRFHPFRPQPSIPCCWWMRQQMRWRAIWQRSMDRRVEWNTVEHSGTQWNHFLPQSGTIKWSPMMAIRWLLLFISWVRLEVIVNFATSAVEEFIIAKRERDEYKAGKIFALSIQLHFVKIYT